MRDREMNKVLVTGAAGFLGNKTALFFKNKGYDVVGWDRNSPKTSFPIQRINLLERHELSVALTECKPDIIIHCAGSASVANSVMDPSGDYDSNVTATHNLLVACHNVLMNDVRFIFLSSAGVYGNPKRLPIDEQAECNPLSPYAVHKLMCEDLCLYFARNYGMRVKIARIFSAYGAGLRKQIFWDMYQKYKESGQLKMFGTGSESRDFIHADDVVQALYLLVNADCKDIIYNVANGEEISIHSVAEFFAELVGASDEKITFNGIVREGDPLNWKADISKIRALGYERKIELRDGMKEFIKWAENINGIERDLQKK